MPGDPLQAIHGGEMLVELTPEREAELLRRYALDQPLPRQFANYLGRLAGGDLGRSYYYAVPVSEVIRGALPWTLLLAGSALVLSSVAGILLGIEAGWRRDRPADRALVGLTGLLNGFPDFLIGALLLVVFGAGLAWFPVSGALTPYAGLAGPALAADVARHLALPLTALTLANLAGMFLLTRGAMLGTIRERYVLTARAKGLRDRTIRYRHAGRAAMSPVAARLGVRVGRLMVGLLFIETIFAYPGVGHMLHQALTMRDYPLLQGFFLVIAVTVLAANLLADIIQHRIDPRSGHAY
ncbi:MAG: ABC transporter permease [Candidatus Desulforudis sp.]|nr:ABC transporter permease [Desulforudis sp.]